MTDLTKEALLTVAGNAALVALLLQFLVKPILDKVGDWKWRDVAVNFAAIILGIGGALLAQAAFGFSYESVLNAILVGVAGGGTAVLGYETLKNIKEAASGG